jgi:hypothetical protein
MNNIEFLNKVKGSFYKYLETDPRSNEKLKILHGAIASDLQRRLGIQYKVHSLGFGDGKEVEMTGRYMGKKVDIGIEKDHKLVGAIALKFIMSNYSQNSNNYFESMLGETANIRCVGKPYFQIVIIPSKVPYYNKEGEITKIETITEHNLSKYIKLSSDNIEIYLHTPNKTLIYLIDMPEVPRTVKNKQQYIDYYKNHNIFMVQESEEPYGFGDGIVYNDYEEFINKVVHSILSI